MDDRQETQSIDYKVVYSKRRTLAISVRSDASVIVRVPLRTSDKTIEKLIKEKSDWIIRHTSRFRMEQMSRPGISYVDGSVHLLRGNQLVLKTEKCSKPFCHYGEGTIEIGLQYPEREDAVKALLYRAYKAESERLFPAIMMKMIEKHRSIQFHPNGLIIRTMKRRWGSCTSKGIITLNTELVRLPEKYLEYVVIHELCHLKHHNHGAGFYDLLSQLFPDWKQTRKELKNYII